MGETLLPPNRIANLVHHWFPASSQERPPAHGFNIFQSLGSFQNRMPSQRQSISLAPGHPGSLAVSRLILLGGGQAHPPPPQGHDFSGPPGGVSSMILGEPASLAVISSSVKQRPLQPHKVGGEADKDFLASSALPAQCAPTSASSALSWMSCFLSKKI